MIVKFTKVRNTAIVPKRMTDGSAGYDLYLSVPCKSERIDSKTTRSLGTGIAMEIPTGYAGFIYARSSFSLNEGLMSPVSVIDSDYRGEISVVVHNNTAFDAMLYNGERVAQLVIAKIEDIDFVESCFLSETDRGTNGFGHTGTN